MINRVIKTQNNNSLGRFLNPKNVVVIGGGVWGKSIIFQLKKINFSGQIFAVHPSEVEFCGCETYRNISDLPSSIDAAFIGVNRIATVDIVSQLSKVDCGGAVCFAASCAAGCAAGHEFCCCAVRADFGDFGGSQAGGEGAEDPRRLFFRPGFREERAYHRLQAPYPGPGTCRDFAGSGKKRAVQVGR